MKRTLFVFTLFVSIASFAFGQHARFVSQGQIEFEKKVNTFALIKDQIKRWGDDSFSVKAFEDYQKNNPQFKTLKSTLVFGQQQTLFAPIAETVGQKNNWFDVPGVEQNNTIFTETKQGTSIAQKKVFEETYLVKDSVRKIDWKITTEMREIAGYNCRRANAIIMDSIYVVAFYSDQIPVSGGPESFTGLPGMILGLAIPREHVTWFATKVTDIPVSSDKLKAPVKGKPTNNKTLVETLKAVFKNWGSSANENLKNIML